MYVMVFDDVRGALLYCVKVKRKGRWKYRKDRDGSSTRRCKLIVDSA
jgi:hypothetical protein